ncbi:Anthranilate phosphoribosyltransferase [Gossypium arboreum]|uniref:Anthranilate phosphoribosyltransferase n=1 Tax=Gossypium arboreum TaxID=29729 RepID=A0A0B0NRT2_GOSAR|nr:Anthranilate phosphoribosyltransferase [Gossypium arboreum]
MRALLTPKPTLSFSSNQINSRNPNPSRTWTSLHFLNRDRRHRLVGRKPRFIATRALKNPILETRRFIQHIETLSYRSRTRRCLKLKLGFVLVPGRPDRSPRSRLRGELKDEEQVLKALLGAFFAGMTIRANAFPKATQWSEEERCAMKKFWPLLVRALPPDVIFIADPEGSIMGLGSAVGPQFVGNGTSEIRLVGALREILAGGHLGYEEIQGVLKEVLTLKLEDGKSNEHMDRETDRELKAYCLAFDDELGPAPVADVRSLTHYGEPYDGNTRYFRSTLFVVAVRSCYGESSLLHGVEWMPPKGGVTEEQMLKFMGAKTNLSLHQGKELIEAEEVGFAYISKREARSSLYSLIGLREQIKKRPSLETTEKVQQFIRAKGRESTGTGFYHEGYEEPLLMLMKRRGVHSGLVVKGEEGALSMTTRLRSASTSKGLPVNHCSGFRSVGMESACEVDGVSRPSFRLEVSKNIELGLAALRGEKGPAYDRIVLNAGIVDHLLGCDGAEDVP